MTTVSIREAKTHFSALIQRVQRLGEPVIICRHGQAVAEIVPIPRGRRTETSTELKPISIDFDPSEPTGPVGQVLATTCAGDAGQPCPAVPSSTRARFLPHVTPGF